MFVWEKGWVTFSRCHTTDLVWKTKNDEKNFSENCEGGSRIRRGRSSQFQQHLVQSFRKSRFTLLFYSGTNPCFPTFFLFSAQILSNEFIGWSYWFKDRKTVKIGGGHPITNHWRRAESSVFNLWSLIALLLSYFSIYYTLCVKISLMSIAVW